MKDIWIKLFKKKIGKKGIKMTYLTPRYILKSTPAPGGDPLYNKLWRNSRGYQKEMHMAGWIHLQDEFKKEIKQEKKMKRKYRKKPVVIEAIKLTKDSLEECLEFLSVESAGGIAQIFSQGLNIKTLEGIMHANYGDYIIKGVHGEYYPCKPDIFKETYEEVNDDN